MEHLAAYAAHTDPVLQSQAAHCVLQTIPSLVSPLQRVFLSQPSARPHRVFESDLVQFLRTVEKETWSLPAATRQSLPPANKSKSGQKV